MRQFSILVFLALVFGGAVVWVEKESRKVKGVLTQIPELQAQLGDLQVEVKRLDEALQAVKLAQRRPNLKAVASRIRSEQRPAPVRATGSIGSAPLTASDVTSAPPAIDSGGDQEDEEWDKPTVDAEAYREQRDLQQDPYQ